MKNPRLIFLLPALCFLLSLEGMAQNPGNIIRGIGNRIPGGGSSPMGGGGGGNDSLQHRNHLEDSITIRVYYLDSASGRFYDTSVNDFTRRFPIPATHIYLGNLGTATRSILFAPPLREGWDPGFHAFDAYKWSLAKVRFFNTTRPYTELGYVLGTRAEQTIELLHTQNIRPNWNFSLNYRLINAPGFFRNQKTNHNNYLFTSWYQSPKKRYNNYLVLLGNRLQAGENGGLQNTADLDSLVFAKDRFLIPTRIGGSPVYGTDFFSVNLYTGNRYREFNFLLRQQYDLGKKDSLVTDSTIIPLFFPRLRFEHTFVFGKYDYSFRDFPASGGKQTNVPDSAYYNDFYDIALPESDSLLFRDRWSELRNDFSIYQFPDARNQQQFIKLGAELQLLHGTFYQDSAFKPSASLYNFMAHGEYRNRTRNNKWDLQAFGRLYLNGYNIGDYHAYVSLQRLLSQRLGTLQVGFENVNRSPDFTYDARSGFYLEKTLRSFNKENTSHAFASLQLPHLRMQLSGDYYLISNYLYLKDYYQLQQEKTLFNVLRINAAKDFPVGRRWHLRSEVYLQQETGSAEVNMPALYTRNRFQYEGNLGFRNLSVVLGLEARYHSPYKADAYSPVLGRFFYQDSVTISNLPDLNAFLHFRIRSFRAYIRAENLNTARFFGGFQFNNNNLAAPSYPTPGLVLRFGIFWGFVN